MRARKLQRLAQGERESKTVYQSESERNHPPASCIAADDVFERHVNDRDGDQRFYQWRKPQRPGSEIKRGCDKRDRMCDGERCDDRNQRPESTKRNDETEQKQEMIRSSKNVEKTE